MAEENINSKTEEDIKNQDSTTTYNKVPEIQDDANKIEFFENISDIIFFLNLISALFSVINFKYKLYFFITTVIFSLTYIILTRSVDIFLKNTEEIEKRKEFIKNSFNSNLSEDTTQLNNNNNNNNNINEKESIKKMGINCFKSLFFTDFILNKMVFEKNVKTFALIFFYVVLLTQAKNLQGFVLLFTQTYFVIEYFFKYLKFHYFRGKVFYIYNEIYDIFITSPPPKEENMLIAKILEITMNYECLKSFCKVSLSSRILNKYTPSLSQEWDTLYHKKIEDRTS
ncbi:hypothetical protein H8356DRAFT_1730208 [Neocallimastix lanati (nom. inval.)]|nr:hypothetical protein H8356DRAFT_1730208 [Neocallimastix sp. JGI-2020a]